MAVDRDGEGSGRCVRVVAGLGEEVHLPRAGGQRTTSEGNLLGANQIPVLEQIDADVTLGGDSVRVRRGPGGHEVAVLVDGDSAGPAESHSVPRVVAGTADRGFRIKNSMGQI